MPLFLAAILWICFLSSPTAAQPRPNPTAPDEPRGLSPLQGSARRGRPAVDFRIIVHTDNPARRIDEKTLSRIFLKKVSRWDSGLEAMPVDQQNGPLREAFTEAIHSPRSVTAIKQYWQWKIFSGRGAPPPELDSDAEVVDFVSRHLGAVGYVAAGIDLDDGVRVLEVVEE